MDSICSEYGIATAAVGIANRRNKNENQMLVRKLQRLEKEVFLASKKMLRDRQEVRFQMLKLKAVNSPVIHHHSPLPTIDHGLHAPLDHHEHHLQNDDLVKPVSEIVVKNSLPHRKLPLERQRSESDSTVINKQLGNNPLNYGPMPRRRFESDTKLLQKSLDKPSNINSPLARRRLLLSQHHNSESNLFQRSNQSTTSDQIHPLINDNKSNDHRVAANIKTKVAFTGDKLIISTSSSKELHPQQLRRKQQLSNLVLPCIQKNNKTDLHFNDEDESDDTSSNVVGPLTKCYMNSPSPTSSYRSRSDTFKADHLEHEWSEEITSLEEEADSD